ncbi:anhydro-N-acetylmuramic acid kinase [bacterium]|nr:anhydro-N-acetylmuramic acid kinase [bacterium]
MHPVQEIMEKSSRLAIGLMSGTSIDSVDAALVEIANNGTSTEVELIGFWTEPYPHGVKEKISECSTSGRGTVDEICRLNVLVGEVFAEAALALLSSSHIAAKDVDFIGSHGQTVHHLPEADSFYGRTIRATLQIGEPSVISKRTGILTVADFRPGDLALGGQGAPLVPYFDYVVFSDPAKNRAMLNVGGIANLTILKSGGLLDEVIAFDCGPGNMVIDGVMAKLYAKPFDIGGRVGQAGTISAELLSFCLEHPYFQKRPPKSTGREDFGEKFQHDLLSRASELKLSVEDTVATATELTTHAIWESYRVYASETTPIDELIVSGGGAKNEGMTQSLREKFTDVSVVSTDAYGIPPDAKEAICFAVLANETISGLTNNVPSATGASRETIMGKICF